MVIERIGNRVSFERFPNENLPINFRVSPPYLIKTSNQKRDIFLREIRFWRF